MTQLLKAAPVVEAQIEQLKEQFQELNNKGIKPLLKIVLVGDNPASQLYTKNKKKFSEKVGANCEIIKLDEATNEEKFLEVVQEINNDSKTHGLLIQLPLPDHLKHLDVTTLVNVNKDVDGFHPLNVFSLYKGENENSSLAPCTPKGIITLCKFYGIQLEGKKIAVIGRSLIVGKPMSLILNNYNATVTLCHSKTKDLQEITKSSDIIISAVGKSEYLDESYVSQSKEQIIIDVGMNKNHKGKTCGDCNFKSISPLVKAITPVPGGVGPMTILSLAQNLLQAAKKSL